MFSRLSIDYYGSSTPITQLSSINVPEARLVVIKPYEQSQLKPIEDAIRNSDLGVNPSNDGNVIRVAIPQLTEERRRELVKQAKAKGEDARVSVRNIRRKAMEELHRIKKDGEAGEDEVKHAEKDLDKTTPPVRRPDRRAGQTQRRRTAGGLMADQQPGPVAKPVEEPPKKSRAGRNLPAAIGVGVVLGAMAIGILLFAPIWWLPVLAVAIPIAMHEVIRRLREAGYALPVIPLLLGGQAMIWLTFYGPAGVLGAYGGTIVVCMVWRLVGQACASSRSTTCATSRRPCCSRRGCRCSRVSVRC